MLRQTKFKNLFLIIVAGSVFVFLFQPVTQPVPEATPSASSGQVIPPPPAPITKSAVDEVKPAAVLHNVPFTSQAPLGNWADQRQQLGCEEASAMMAMAWIKGETFIPKEAEKEIIAISKYELKNYGVYGDTSAKDTVDWILKGYFNYDKARLVYDIGIEDIKGELAAGNVVLAPINGRTVGNPYYYPPGPLRHMILIVGFDDDKKQFIANDPATINGKNIRFSYDRLQTSLRDYDTGYYKPIKSSRTAMVVVSK